MSRPHAKNSAESKLPSWTGGAGGGRTQPPASPQREGDRHTNQPALKAIRRDLRNNATPAECVLWRMLKQRQLHGRKFRRQHSIGRYVLDFYCPEEKLTVEVDGSVHDDPLRHEYDSERQIFLEGLGIRVLRFKNQEVLKTPEMVVDAIALYFRTA